MKHNWLVTGSLAAAWFFMLNMILIVHWRPARLLMPVVSIILFIYLVICTIYWVWGKPKSEEKSSAEPDKGQAGVGLGKEEEK